MKLSLKDKVLEHILRQAYGDAQNYIKKGYSTSDVYVFVTAIGTNVPRGITFRELPIVRSCLEAKEDYIFLGRLDKVIQRYGHYDV